MATPTTDPSRGAYSARDVARALGLSVAQIRSFARAGLVEPQRGPRGELRFEYRDLVFLRRVRDLSEARIPPRRVRHALDSLRARLPEGAFLEDVRLAAAGRAVLVREGERLWSPESGQFVFDFETSPPVSEVLPFVPRERDARTSAEAGASAPLVMGADDWQALGCELEPAEPDAAREAYQRALALDPAHADAHLNLGCLYHEAGKLPEAEAHYRAAASARPGDATAAFDLGVVLEDQQRSAEAREAYQRALALAPDLADAHYNLARLFDAAGDRASAIRHLKAYRNLSREV